MRDGGDVTVIACGALVAPALEAADTLAADGVDRREFSICTPSSRSIARPFSQAAAETKGIVTAEEHHLTGGLGGAVAELVALEHPCRMRFIGMPDEFAVVGPTGQVREKYGMDANSIAAACRQILA